MGQLCYSVINVLHIVCWRQGLVLDAPCHVLAASLTFLVSDDLILSPFRSMYMCGVYIMRQENSQKLMSRLAYGIWHPRLLFGLYEYERNSRTGTHTHPVHTKENNISKYKGNQKNLTQYHAVTSMAVTAIY